MRGSVLDDAGHPVFDATVTLMSASAGFSRHARTTRQGEFAYRFTQPGEYVLLVEKVGYHPVRISGIVVRAGHHVRLEAAVEPASAGRAELRELRYSGTSGRVGSHQTVAGFLLHDLPDAGRDLISAGRFSTTFDESLGAAGLPGRWTALRVDGFPVWPVSLPGRTGAGPLTNLPLAWIAEAELIGATADLGWGGAPGAYVDAQTRAGTRELHVEAFGSWSSDALTSSSHFESEATPFSTFDLRLAASGPIIPDTATFAIGLLARRLGTAHASAWLPGPWASAVVDAADRAGLDAQGAFSPHVTEDRALGAYGRVDWRLSASHALRLTGAWSARDGDLQPGYSGLAGPNAPGEGGDLLAGAALVSEFGSRLVQHVLVSFNRSEQVPDLHTSGEGLPAAVTLLDEGISLDADPAALLGVRHSALHVEQATHLFGASGHLQVGVQAGFWTHERDHARAGSWERFHGSAARWIDGVGSEVRIEGTPPSARWNALTIGAFTQARWRAAPGLDLTAGLRFDLETLPRDDVRRNEDWFTRAGLSNAELLASATAWSPRAGLEWDIAERGQWFAFANAGLHTGRIDPGVIAELLVERGTATVVRSLGDLAAAGGQGGGVATESGRRLTLLGPDFAAPRALIASAGISRATAAGWTISVSADLRRTELLPRRRNLNLLPDPVAEDQHGRPIFGRLVKQGALIAAEPGSERRFSDFDVVSAIDADGRSEYGGVTFAVDGSVAPGIEVAGSYTYSRTRDDWTAGGTLFADRQLPPLVDGAGVLDWREGYADTDVPHRLLLAAAVRLPLPIETRIAAAYTYRSGRPFTPSLRAGVDANGDGSARNDPAFVDDRIPGMDALLDEWPCLRHQVGGFAERNSCRSEPVHRLDLRFSARIAAAGRYLAAIVVDGENLMESVVTPLDVALHLVAGSRALEVDEGAGTIAVPYVANTGFGKPLARRTSGRVIRIGLQLAF